MDMKNIVKNPIFFEENRVYRVYLGGKGFEGFLPNAEDGFFPEEWVASKVKAINPRYFGKRDGVAVVKGTDIFFDDLLNEYPDELLGGKKYDCLVKFLDSAIRLPVQVHPTKEFSRKYFNSEYGKTEAWLVVATRENPSLYFGFNKKITREDLAKLEDESENERDAMTTVLQRVTPEVGDVYLISAGLIHAIGAGCTIVEIQEPTDFTIQPEAWCGDYRISENERYIGLERMTALDCFNYDLYGDKALEIAKKEPRIVKNENGVKIENLITYADTPCFALDRYTLCGGEIKLENAPAVYIVIDGTATLQNGTEVNRGGFFFLPYSAKGITLKSENATVLACLPSKQ